MMAFEDEIRYILSSSGESLWITDSAWRLANTWSLLSQNKMS
jgi:hypothetical protein